MAGAIGLPIQLAALLLWLLVFLAVARLGMPVAARVLPHDDDRLAAGLGLPLGLAVLWLIGFLVGRIALGPAAWLGVAALAGVAFLAEDGRFGQPLAPSGYREVAVVFSLGFLLVVVIRALDPGAVPGGGEKFLDFGLLSSLLRAETVPPIDPWFAGEPVSYYYGGHLLSAQLARVTFTPPALAYNLALAGFFGALVGTAYGLAGGIGRAASVSGRVAGGFAAFFVGIASNLAPPVWFLSGFVPSVGVPILESVGLARGRFDATTMAYGHQHFSRWHPNGGLVDGIHEFPLFAWMNGDLHAHMMSTPFMLLVAGLLFAYYRTPADDRRRRALVLFGLLPPLGALLAVTNTWSFPAVGGLTALAVYFADASPGSLLSPTLADRLRRTPVVLAELIRAVVALATGTVVLALGFGWSLPFWLGTATGRSLAFFPEPSPLGGLLLVHGTFLAVFVPYLAVNLVRQSDLRTSRLVVAVALAVGAVGLLVDLVAVALFATLLAVAWWLLRSVADSNTGDRSSGPGYETVLFVAAVGLVLLVEFVYVQEQAGPGRLNTVFKVYSQVWILFAVGAGAALARLVSRRDVGGALLGGRWRRVARVFAAVLVVSTSIYAGLALYDHATTAGADGEPLTLDATEFVEHTHPGEVAAIDWVRDLDGQPTVLQAPGRQVYSWASAPASLTGVPTVVGWVSHERGYGRETADERAADVDAMYTGSPATQRDLLVRYEVRYVYVGPDERAAYEEITVDELPAVTEAVTRGDVTIYEVDLSAVTCATTTTTC